MRSSTFAQSLAWLLTLSLEPAPARAQEASDKAAAEALYQLGQRGMAEGKYSEACPKLEASAKLDPGVGTLLFLGDCQEKWGKLASAWATFHEAMALASSRGDGERASVAELRATALHPRLSRVVYNVDARNRMPSFELRRNGTLVSSGSWGVALPSDAGSYELIATAPGYESWSATLSIRAEVSEPMSVQVPELRPIGVPSETGSARAGTASVERASVAEHPASSQKTWGAVTFSVGTALAITSGVLAFMATRKNTESKEHCREDQPNLCQPDGLAKRNDAQHLASVSMLLGIGGGAVLATGTVLFLSAPTSEHGVPTGLAFELHSRF